jgi:hypothetical protein
MSPRKGLINKSRGVGQRKRQTKPKTDSVPTPVAPEPAPIERVEPSPPVQTPTTGYTQAKPLAAATTYTGLDQVPHGLKIPTFQPNSYFASDLFANSSGLGETEKAIADVAVSSIEKKRQTLRIVGANIALNTDVVRTANEYRKFEGAVIDYASTGVNNEAKFINYQTAGVNRDIAENRFQQAGERLDQGIRTLNGMRSITPLIDEEWAERKKLKQSKIADLRTSVLKATSLMDERLGQLSDGIAAEYQDIA